MNDRIYANIIRDWLPENQPDLRAALDRAIVLLDREYNRLESQHRTWDKRHADRRNES